ncbi:Uncharacterised protein [Bordetella pertussis]|nr:Uncharacterised protein [Bordetella pertussis]
MSLGVRMRVVRQPISVTRPRMVASKPTQSPIR